MYKKFKKRVASANKCYYILLKLFKSMLFLRKIENNSTTL